MTEAIQQPYGVTLPEGMFRHLNRVVARDYGADLFTLADTAPEAAYGALSKGIAEVVLAGRHTTVDANTGFAVDSRQDSRNAQKGFTEKMLEGRIAPPVEFEPRDVVINVIKRRTLWQVVKKQEPKTEIALTFTVNPS